MARARGRSAHVNTEEAEQRALARLSSEMPIADLLRLLPDCASCGALIPVARGVRRHELDFCDMRCQQNHARLTTRETA